MNAASRALMVVGSLKKPRSTSEVLGSHLLDRLTERGWQTETLRLKPALWTEHGETALITALQEVDLLILAFPLYVDSLPALVTKALETIATYRRETLSPRRLRLLAVVNCGFPEARQNDVALAICRQFARETGVEWLGGLALGGGQSIDGQPLTARGGMLRNVVRALDLTVEDVAAGRPISSEAVALMSKPLMPNWLYTAFGNLGWRWRARKNQVKVRLSYRPFET